MLAYFKVIRPFNLLMIIFIGYLIRYALIAPVLAEVNLQPYLSFTGFTLMLGSLVLLAAGAYVINDMYDIEIDRVNKPTKWYVGNTITEKQALNYYYGLNAVAIMLAVYCAYLVNDIRLASLQLISVAVNWLYATRLKKTTLVGNLAVSVSAAMVIVMPLLFEPIVFHNAEALLEESVNTLIAVGAGLAFFALIISLIRELIKAFEDQEGDRIAGVRSVPIVFGERVTAGLIQLLILLLVGSIYWLQHKFVSNVPAEMKVFKQVTWYFAATVQLPLLVLFAHLFLVNRLQKKHYKFYSQFLKIIMLAGIGVLFFIKAWFEQK